MHHVDADQRVVRPAGRRRGGIGPPGIEQIEAERRERLLQLAAILIGTSYFKAAPATVLRFGFALTDEARRLADERNLAPDATFRDA